MKDIFFGDVSKYKRLKHLTSATTHVLAKTFPKMSSNLGLKVLCNPQSKRSYKFKTELPYETIVLQAPEGLVELYRFKGTGKTILLNHGWGDTSKSFSHLINHYATLGFDVWCFDNVGHGHSHGNIAHIYSFISGLQTVIEHIEHREKKEIKTLIGHSMGAVAILNLSKRYLDKKKIVCISTPINFFELMFQKINSVGISDAFLGNLLERVSNGYEESWQELHPCKNLQKVQSNAIFIHDTDDRFAPFVDLIATRNLIELNIKETSGLGHVRILNSPLTIELINQHIGKR